MVARLMRAGSAVWARITDEKFDFFDRVLQARYVEGVVSGPRLYVDEKEYDVAFRLSDR